ncbi:HAD-IIIA family hydrolase [Terrabacter sp. NPDC080008]|uniref:HAD-IIIA family hydrolase n=1 Tax=Terrabacter sp. NPDC080008 TaxID=3155176 RepID=UPI00344BF893
MTTSQAGTTDGTGEPGAGEPVTTIVVPTIGRDTLLTLLERLAGQSTTVTAPVLLVDDRREDHPVAPPAWFDELPFPVTVLRSGGRGPAAARNLGWRHARTPWVSFVDDDVLPGEDWYAHLLEDLRRAGPDVVGSQGRLKVPLPVDRRPTDWERSTAGLEGALWITADMSFRRAVLAAVGGFDERFPRAYREDVDLGLRATEAGGRIEWGEREVLHPVRPADDWVSVRRQNGNLDDALMRRLHGRDWRARTHAARGRLPLHVATVAAGMTSLAATVLGRRRAATVAGLGWAALTAEFLTARVRPGPRDRREVARMAATSVAIPFAAVAYAVRGRLRHRTVEPWRGTPDLVLLDRDGTIVHDVPYNSDPDAVRPVDGARESLDRLRANGIRIGVVTNQSGVGRGLLTEDELHAVNARVEQLLGPFDVWNQCLHAPDEGCDCRKPEPGLVLDACARLGVDPGRTVVVGDIRSDMAAAGAAGAVGVLVPNGATRREEVDEATLVAPDLGSAVDALLGGRW